MKKLFYLIGIVSILLIGCSKNNDLQLEKENVVVLPEVNLSDIVKSFDSEIATFSNQNEYSAFIMKFSELPIQEKQNLISLVKYKTIDEILDEAYEGMNNLQTREEFVEYLKQYNDYLELVKLPNGDEEVQEKEITGHGIYSFLNGDKIIKVGDVYKKYFSKLCVESKSRENLLRIKKDDDIFNSGLKYFVSYTPNQSELNDSEIQLRWGENDTYRRWEKENDKYWCKNKRKVRLTVGFPRFTTLIDPRGDGHFLHQDFVSRQAKVTAFRKGIVCIWYPYKTKIIWNDFHLEYDTNWNGDIQHFTWNHANETKYASSIDRGNLLKVFVREWQLFDTQYTIIRSKITTRGIWDKWLKVDWHN